MEDRRVELLETSRLRLRALEASDAGFIQALLTDADWLRYIGDRGVSNLREAHVYVEKQREGYRRGFGLLAVVTEDNRPSQRVLVRLGLTPAGAIEGPVGESLRLYEKKWPPPPR